MACADRWKFQSQTPLHPAHDKSGGTCVPIHNLRSLAFEHAAQRWGCRYGSAQQNRVDRNQIIRAACAPQVIASASWDSAQTRLESARSFC